MKDTITINHILWNSKYISDGYILEEEIKSRNNIFMISNNETRVFSDGTVGKLTSVFPSFICGSINIHYYRRS